MYEYELIIGSEVIEGIASADEIAKMSRVYEKEDFKFKRLPEGELSFSEKTAFCPNKHCFHMINLEKGKEVYECPVCHDFFVVKN